MVNTESGTESESDLLRKKKKTTLILGLLVILNFIVVWVVLAWRL